MVEHDVLDLVHDHEDIVGLDGDDHVELPGGIDDGSHLCGCALNHRALGQHVDDVDPVQEHVEVVQKLAHLLPAVKDPAELAVCLIARVRISLISGIKDSPDGFVGESCCLCLLDVGHKGLGECDQPGIAVKIIRVLRALQDKRLAGEKRRIH